MHDAAGTIAAHMKKAPNHALRLRADAQSLRLREITLPRVEAPKFRRPQSFCGGEMQDVETAVPLALGPCRRQNFRTPQHHIRIQLRDPKHPRLFVSFVVGQPVTTLRSGNWCQRRSPDFSSVSRGRASR